MKIFSLLSICFLVLCLSLAPAQAQTNSDTNAKLSQNMTFDLPPPDQIEGRHLIEMDRIYQECLADIFMSSHRDCRCYSMAYLEARLQTPNVERQVVERALRQVCYDPETMAGYYFEQCTSTVDANAMLMDGKDPAGYCECFGRAMTRIVPQLPRIDFRKLGNAQTRAYIECQRFR